MITNAVQYGATKDHLVRFEEAARNLEARLKADPSKLARLELDAVRAQARDLRAEIDQYDHRRGATR